jgi:alpha-tubulin suppressor-like RCC1 family protein
MKWVVILDVVLLSSCHSRSHPGHDAGDAACVTNQECDDGHNCTHDICELPQGECWHSLLPVGTVCRPNMGECDTAETCDGMNVDCPADSVEPATTVCREAVGPCDEPEYCDGFSPSCPDDVFSPSDKACDDGDACTRDDRCDGAGGCAGINGLIGVEAISSGPGAFFNCTSMADGGLRCWGNNNYGQLGDGTNEHHAIPTAVVGLPAGDPIVQLAAGGRHVSVLLESGRIMAWGLGDTGQLGNGMEGGEYESHSPVNVIWNPGDTTPAYGWIQVASGYLFNCALHEDGRVFCWGKNDKGQLGVDPATLDWVTVPFEIPSLAGASSVVAGNYHACAIDDAGAVVCWGWNNHGQIGNPAAPDPSPVPVSVEGLAGRVTDVALGIIHTCALLESGAVMCWGANEKGQLGNGEGGEVAPDSVTPVEVSSLPGTVLDIDSEYEHTCALLEGGEVMCWGNNDSGQIGDGTSDPYKVVPVSVAGLPSAVASIALGALHSCALLENTTVWCWGHNAYGELGIGVLSDEGSTMPLEVICR